MKFKILCISDTHDQTFDLPEADLCIHAGDLTMDGRTQQIDKQLVWLKSQAPKFKYGIIFTPGNHDWWYMNKDNYKDFKEEKVRLFIDESIEIEGIKIWLSPWSKWFFDWAFNIPLDKLKEQWVKISEDVNILVTHGQPFGINDLCRNGHVGDDALLNRIKELKGLKMYVGGHIHEGSGYCYRDNKLFVNASVLDGRYYKNGYCYIVDYPNLDVEKVDLKSI